MCTWSTHRCPSNILQPRRLVNSWNTPTNSSRILPYKTFFRYFGGCVIVYGWYYRRQNFLVLTWLLGHIVLPLSNAPPMTVLCNHWGAFRFALKRWCRRTDSLGATPLVPARQPKNFGFHHCKELKRWNPKGFTDRIDGIHRGLLISALNLPQVPSFQPGKLSQCGFCHFPVFPKDFNCVTNGLCQVRVFFHVQ